MLHLLKIFLDICRLKALPQDLPRENLLLILVILAGIVVDSVATSVLIPDLSNIQLVMTVTTYNIVMLVLIYILLIIVGYAKRGMQTVTAIAGSGLTISLVLLPSLLIMASTGNQVKTFSLFILIDNLWRIAVNAHIFRHALSVGYLLATVLSVSYLILGILIGDLLLSLHAVSELN